MLRFRRPVLAAGLPGVAVGARDMLASASLLLLVGGLAMLLLIVVLVVVQNLLPDRSPRPGSAARGRELRPLAGPGPSAPETRTRRRRRRPRPAASSPRVDEALGRVVAQNLGEPRLLRSLENVERLRLYNCRGCAGGQGTQGGDATYCATEGQGIEQAFREVFGRAVAVVETRCLLRGDAACEFEVRH